MSTNEQGFFEKSINYHETTPLPFFSNEELEWMKELGINPKKR
jgi:hypothetical protein